jgi:uncharacterized protein with HEPN domain
MKNPDNKKLVLHIKDACESIFKFIEGKNYDDFSKNDMLLSAVIRKLEVIGEASSKTTDEYRNENQEVPWSIMIGMRNRLIHGYFGVNSKTVWDTVKEDIPILYDKILNL